MADLHFRNSFTAFTLWNSHFLTFLLSKLLTVLQSTGMAPGLSCIHTAQKKVVIQERIQAQNRSVNTIIFNRS